MLALARGLLHLLYDTWRTEACAPFWYPPRLPLAPVLHALCGVQADAAGGLVAGCEHWPPVLRLVQTLSQLPGAPIWNLAPTFWADAMVQSVDEVLDALALSLCPPRQRGRPRRLVHLAEQIHRNWSDSRTF